MQAHVWKMTMKVLPILLLLWIPVSYAYDSCYYPTAFDSAWMRKCPKGSFVSHLVSSFQKRFQDRMWMVCCRDLTSRPAPVKCGKWTGYKNKFLSTLNFRCPRDSFINGMASLHSDQYEDRRYKFRCCKSPRMTLKKCTSAELNTFGAEINFNVTSSHVITGLKSSFNAINKDRKFQALVCEMKV